MFVGRGGVLIAAGLWLAACAGMPVPPGYTGPLAHVTDSVTPRDAQSVDLFYVSRLGDFPIDNSLDATEGANRGGGDRKPVVIGRDVPADAQTFTIIGMTRYSSPLLAFTHPAYEISGAVSFTPEPGHAYVVKGVLGETYSAVWIEDEATQKLAGSKIELNGPATLGLFGKLGIR